MTETSSQRAAPAPTARRAWAFLLDAGLAAVPAGIAALLVRGAVGGPRGDAAAVAVLVLGVPVVLAWLALVMRTPPGKRAAGLRVVGPDGHEAGAWRLVRRELVGRLGVEHVLLLVGGAGAAGYLWLLRDRERQAWHDRIAGTRVVVLGAEAPLVVELGPPRAPRAALAAGGLAYAGLWERVGALLLDLSLVATVDLTIVGAIGVASGAVDVGRGSGAPAWFGVLLAASMPVVFVLYAAIAIALRGTTVGKHALGLVVVRSDDGGRVRLGRALLREVVGRGLVEIGCGAAVVGLATVAGHLAAAGRRHQAWHDAIAGTTVVRAAPRAYTRRVDNVPMEPAHSGRDVHPAPHPQY